MSEEQYDEQKDLVDRMVAWELDELNFDQELALFRELITSGLINGLQGSYQRRARYLIDARLLS